MNLVMAGSMVLVEKGSKAVGGDGELVGFEVAFEADSAFLSVGDQCLEDGFDLVVVGGGEVSGLVGDVDVGGELGGELGVGFLEVVVSVEGVGEVAVGEGLGEEGGVELKTSVSFGAEGFGGELEAEGFGDAVLDFIDEVEEALFRLRCGGIWGVDFRAAPLPMTMRAAPWSAAAWQTFWAWARASKAGSYSETLPGKKRLVAWILGMWRSSSARAMAGSST